MAIQERYLKLVPVPISERITTATRYAQEHAPVIRNWTTPTDEDVYAFNDFWVGLRQHCHNSCYDIDKQHNLEGLTPNRSFPEHINLMVDYVSEAYKAGIFNEFGVSKNFLIMLVLMHDGARNVFNKLPPALNDSLSHELESEMFPDFPSEWLHKMEWLTGAEPLDVHPKGNGPIVPQLETLPKETKFGLILKLFDNLSKKNQVTGKLLTLEDYVLKNGHYRGTYLPNAIKDRKFPFDVDVIDPDTKQTATLRVDAHTYARADIRACLWGAKLIKMLTNNRCTISDLTDRVDQLHQTRSNSKVLYQDNIFLSNFTHHEEPLKFAKHLRTAI